MGAPGDLRCPSSPRRRGRLQHGGGRTRRCLRRQRRDGCRWLARGSSPVRCWSFRQRVVYFGGAIVYNISEVRIPFASARKVKNTARAHAMASLSDAPLFTASARLRFPLASARKHASTPWAFAIIPPSRREAEGQAARARSHTAQEKAQQEDQFHAQETWRGRIASGRRKFEVALAPHAREREHKYGGTETIQKEQSQESDPLLVGVRTPWPSRARLPPVAHFYKLTF